MSQFNNINSGRFSCSKEDVLIVPDDGSVAAVIVELFWAVWTNARVLNECRD